ncbi:phage portal protein [Marinifilum flexuosum]|uniref:phage portal protein n=1 Tax=Marinifilum flexuosum TaxID=1117708 RepID=UPI00249579BA|nr:phage portal protein [Marinifilum flexuosum]
MGFLQNIRGLFSSSNTHNSFVMSNGVYGYSMSGESITEQDALKVSAFFAGIKVISETVASLPLHIYAENGDSREIYRKHHLYSKLHDNPSPLYTKFEFIQLLVELAYLYGDSYARIIRDKRTNKPERFKMLHPYDVDIIVDHINDLLYYEYKPTGEKLNYNEVIHIKRNSHSSKTSDGINLPGIAGTSVIDYARDNLGLIISTERFGSQFFKTGHIKGVVEIPGSLTKDQAKDLKAALDYIKTNKSSHNTPLLPPGVKYVQVGTSPNDSQFNETKRQCYLEIGMFLRVPVYKFGMLENSSFSSNEQQEIEFIKDTIQPIVIMLEQEFNRKVFTTEEQKHLYVKFNVDGRLRGDTKTRAEYYRTMREIGAMTADEVRALENMNKLTPEQKAELKEEQANKIRYQGKDSKTTEKEEKNEVKDE